MFWVVIFLAIIAVVGGSIGAGLMLRQQPRGPMGPPGHRLTRAEKLNMAKVAGVMPARKEN